MEIQIWICKFQKQRLIGADTEHNFPDVTLIMEQMNEVT